MDPEGDLLSSTLVERILEPLTARGSAEYFGEPVTQLEHALQCATLAETYACGPVLVTAALLHDVGHLLAPPPTGGASDLHEEHGAAYLARWFGPEVVEPVRLHVLAKRYLCAVDPAYRDGLSAASQRSLELQGGPLAATERAEFEALEHSDAAVRLRRFDESAKQTHLTALPIDAFLPRIEQALGLAGAAP